GSNQSKAAPNGEFDSNVGSDYGFMLEHNQFSNWTSNNVENVYPQFGPYIGSTSAARTNTNVGNDYVHYDNCPNLLCPAADGSSPLFGNTEIGKSNMVTDLNASNSSIPSAFQNMGIPAVVKDFYSNNRGAFAFSLCHAAGPATAGQAPRLPSLWPGPANRRVPLRRQLSSAHELLKEAFALP
ncbi:MAG TPA: hypothetical protein VFE78_08500, partial [Gemmataceae bacterium]|nr:hypothetical protein [Gemmataceae bacterium]